MRVNDSDVFNVLPCAEKLQNNHIPTRLKEKKIQQAPN
jgi:hypothetical protein